MTKSYSTWWNENCKWLWIRDENNSLKCSGEIVTLALNSPDGIISNYSQRTLIIARRAACIWHYYSVLLEKFDGTNFNKTTDLAKKEHLIWKGIDMKRILKAITNNWITCLRYKFRYNVATAFQFNWIPVRKSHTISKDRLSKELLLSHSSSDLFDNLFPFQFICRSCSPK